METALQANPDIIGVLGINDAGNLGAYQALENAGRGPPTTCSSSASTATRRRSS